MPGDGDHAKGEAGHGSERERWDAWNAAADEDYGNGGTSDGGAGVDVGAPKIMGDAIEQGDRG